MTDWSTTMAAAREVLADEGLMPAPELWRRLVARGELGGDTWPAFRTAAVNRQRSGSLPRLPRGRPGPARTRPAPTPRRGIDWSAVLGAARDLLAAHGTCTRRDLWSLLVEDGVLTADTWDAWRAAVAGAQQRGTFPELPADATGPDPGTAWSEDRHAAECVRHDEPTPYELHTKRMGACLDLLDSLAGVCTVRLSPSVFAIFAAQGYGEEIVRGAIHRLVSCGLAELRYEVHGLHAVPVVQAA
jgi:hypothetical protein